MTPRPLTLLLAIALLIPVLSRAEPIKVGVPLALTGTTASWGQDMKNAITFANEKLAGGRYQLLFEDDKCDPRESVSVAHRLIDVEKVKYAVGFCCSGPLLAPRPRCMNAQGCWPSPRPLRRPRYRTREALSTAPGTAMPPA